MTPEIYTIPQAAKYCAVTRATLWRYVKSGKIKAMVTPGGHYRIRKPDLDAFIADMVVRADYGEKEHNKILVVDDDRALVKFMRLSFQDQGYAVETAGDGFEAGRKLESFRPALVVLDLFMPGMNGFEVCRQIKENADTAHIKVIAVTGYDTLENREKIMACGADAYLPKPVSKKDLLQAVRNRK